MLYDYTLAKANIASRIDSIESKGYSIHSCVHLETVYILNDGWDYRMARLILNCIGLYILDRERAKY